MKINVGVGKRVGVGLWTDPAATEQFERFSSSGHRFPRVSCLSTRGIMSATRQLEPFSTEGGTVDSSAAGGRLPWRVCRRRIRCAFAARLPAEGGLRSAGWSRAPQGGRVPTICGPLKCRKQIGGLASCPFLSPDEGVSATNIERNHEQTSPHAREEGELPRA